MDYRDPIVVIDQTIENLVYLVEWWLEDLELAAALNCDLLTTEDVKTISALRVARALLPRLRIIRSNYESGPVLPDASGATKDRVMAEYVEQSRTELREWIGPQGHIGEEPPGT